MRNIPVLDLSINPWDDQTGGTSAQISFWRAEIERTGETFPGERVEFEAFIAANGLENADA